MAIIAIILIYFLWKMIGPKKTKSISNKETKILKAETPKRFDPQWGGCTPYGCPVEGCTPTGCPCNQ